MPRCIDKRVIPVLKTYLLPVSDIRAENRRSLGHVRLDDNLLYAIQRGKNRPKYRAATENRTRIKGYGVKET